MAPHIWSVVLVVLGLHQGATEACGVFESLEIGQSYTFTSPNYPIPYRGYIRCRWTLTSPENSIFNLNCQEFHVRRGWSRCIDRFYFSPSGDLTSRDYNIYCGKGILKRNTTTNSFDVYFSSGYIFLNTAKGFRCVVTVLGNPTITTTPKASTTIVSSTTPEVSSTMGIASTTPGASSTTSVAGTTPGASTTADVAGTTPKASSTMGVTGTIPRTSLTVKVPEESTAAKHTTSLGHSTCKCGQNSLQSRIVGGVETEVHEWPWQVALRFSSSGHQFCGGSLIDPSWVLTAAHCVVALDVKVMIVSIGEHDTNTGSDTSHTVHRTISQKIAHSGYHGGSIINDIAVIQLSSPVEYSHGISPVCLPTNLRSQTFDGEDATVTGWGTTSFQGSSSNTLLEVTLPVISNTVCGRLNHFNIRNDQVCTYQEGKDSCQGDSGGPLVWLDDNGHYQQIGIVSWGIGCAGKDRPGVYTRVTSYIDWIEENTNTNFCST